MSGQDHDHSGDRLGEDTPVESIDVEEVTIRDFAISHSFVVYEDGGRWHAFRTADQAVVSSDADGAEVINRALDQVGGAGSVLVTANAGGSIIESETPILHTTDGTALKLEPGVTFRYTGSEQAVILAGDGISFEFARIEARNASYGIVDLGLRNATVDGQTLASSGETVWLSDAEDRVAAGPGPSGTHVRILQVDCSAGADRGITLTSAAGGSIEGYRWEVAVIHPEETGILVGDDSAADTVHNQTFYASVKGRASQAASLVEVNDSRNGVFLETHTPATGGDWDVVIRESVEDALVLPLTGRDTIRVKREAYGATDFSKFDQFRHEVMELELDPESLAGYEEIEAETGETSLAEGLVVHETGEERGSWANVRKRMDFNFGRLRFDNAATLQTHVEVAENDDQQGWLLWGDREGPGVGWYVEDDVLYGFVRDGHGDSPEMVPLVEGFGAGTSWKLTAFYNPPTDVHFYVDDRNAGSIDRGLPSDTPGAHRILTVDLTNTGPGSKRLRWSVWKNHQYPVEPTENGVRGGGIREPFEVSGTREDDGSVFTGGQTDKIDLALEPSRDARVRDRVPSEWTVLDVSGADVERTEENGDTLVYFPDATGDSDEPTEYTYFVEAPDDVTDSGRHEFGPVEVLPVEPAPADEWVPVTGTTDTNTVVAQSQEADAGATGDDLDEEVTDTAVGKTNGVPR
jgi:hypothetical protein